MKKEIKKEIKYNKLVRDKIPMIIEKAGKTCTTHIADEIEYQDRLFTKLQEEADELRAEPSAEEVADILEVLHAIVDAYGLDMNEAMKIREEKREKRGGFEDRIVLGSVVESVE